MELISRMLLWMKVLNGLKESKAQARSIKLMCIPKLQLKEIWLFPGCCSSTGIADELASRIDKKIATFLCQELWHKISWTIPAPVMDTVLSAIPWISDRRASAGTLKTCAWIDSWTSSEVSEEAKRWMLLVPSIKMKYSRTWASTTVTQPITTSITLHHWFLEVELEWTEEIKPGDQWPGRLDMIRDCKPTTASSIWIRALQGRMELIESEEASISIKIEKEGKPAIDNTWAYFNKEFLHMMTTSSPDQRHKFNLNFINDHKALLQGFSEEQMQAASAWLITNQFRICQPRTKSLEPWIIINLRAASFVAEGIGRIWTVPTKKT